MLPVSQLRATDSVREGLDKEHVARLACSMKARGFDLSYPLTVSPASNGIHDIRKGSHRFFGGLEAGIDKFPCVIATEKGTSETDRILEDWESNISLGNSPLDNAKTAQACAKKGMSGKKIAARMFPRLDAKSGAVQVSNLLRLNSAPECVKDLIRLGAPITRIMGHLGKLEKAVKENEENAQCTLEQWLAECVETAEKLESETERNVKRSAIETLLPKAPAAPAPTTDQAPAAQVRGVLRNVGSKGDLILNPFGCGIHAASVKLAMDWIDQAAELPDVLCPKTSLGEVVRRKDILSHLKMLHAVLVRHA